MPEQGSKQESQGFYYQFFGWVLFVLCAVFFILSSMKHGDNLALTGSIIFLVACICFMVPLIQAMAKDRKAMNKRR